jgi:hypothetical protein
MRSFARLLSLSFPLLLSLAPQVAKADESWLNSVSESVRRRWEGTKTLAERGATEGERAAARARLVAMEARYGGAAANAARAAATSAGAAGTTAASGATAATGATAAAEATAATGATAASASTASTTATGAATATRTATAAAGSAETAFATGAAARTAGTVASVGSKVATAGRFIAGRLNLPLAIASTAYTMYELGCVTNEYMEARAALQKSQAAAAEAKQRLSLMLEAKEITNAADSRVDQMEAFSKCADFGELDKGSHAAPTAEFGAVCSRNLEGAWDLYESHKKEGLMVTCESAMEAIDSAKDLIEEAKAEAAASSIDEWDVAIDSADQASELLKTCVEQAKTEAWRLEDGIYGSPPVATDSFFMITKKASQVIEGGRREPYCLRFSYSQGCQQWSEGQTEQQYQALIQRNHEDMAGLRQSMNTGLGQTRSGEANGRVCISSYLKSEEIRAQILRMRKFCEARVPEIAQIQSMAQSGRSSFGTVAGDTGSTTPATASSTPAASSGTSEAAALPQTSSPVTSSSSSIVEPGLGSSGTSASSGGGFTPVSAPSTTTNSGGFTSTPTTTTPTTTTPATTTTSTGLSPTASNTTTATNTVTTIGANDAGAIDRRVQQVQAKPVNWSLGLGVAAAVGLGTFLVIRNQDDDEDDDKKSSSSSSSGSTSSTKTTSSGSTSSSTTSTKSTTTGSSSSGSSTKTITTSSTSTNCDSRDPACSSRE